MKTTTLLNLMALYTLLLATFSLSACSSKFLQIDKLRDKERVQEKTSLESVQNESLIKQQITLISDSTENAYKVLIFPIDTFTFSPTEGFKGKAYRLETTGIAKQLKKTRDSSTVVSVNEMRLEYDNKQDQKTMESSSSRVVEKKRIGLGLGMVLFGIFCLIVWFGMGRRRLG